MDRQNADRIGSVEGLVVDRQDHVGAGLEAFGRLGPERRGVVALDPVGQPLQRQRAGDGRERGQAAPGVRREGDRPTVVRGAEFGLVDLLDAHVDVVVGTPVESRRAARRRADPAADGHARVEGTEVEDEGAPRAVARVGEVHRRPIDVDRVGPQDRVARARVLLVAARDGLLDRRTGGLLPQHALEVDEDRGRDAVRHTTDGPKRRLGKLGAGVVARVRCRSVVEKELVRRLRLRVKVSGDVCQVRLLTVGGQSGRGKRSGRG
mmetsp:Transcript_15075/g.46515  ORF Transcript_15075/g.46515 Transcript_15075/m.46515 type:complete len:264 (-) Transcript_15075:45-836(-)